MYYLYEVGGLQFLSAKGKSSVIESSDCLEFDISELVLVLDPCLESVEPGQ